MGQLVEIEGGEMAFVPAPLPREYELSPALWRQLSEVNSWIGRARQIGETSILNNPAILIRPLQLRESLRSSSLEGTYVEPDELLLFDPEDEESLTKDERKDSVREAYNLARAIESGEALAEKYGLTLWLVRALHQKLMEAVRGGEKEPGEWRSIQVFIGRDHRFIPQPPHLLQASLQDLEDAMVVPKSVPALVWAMMVHYQFETIHPFRDGNGRVGRALLSLMLAKTTELVRPWVYLSPFFERHRDEYVRLLFDVSSKGDWENWLSFCLEGTRDSCADTVGRLTALIELWKQWVELVKKHRMNVRILALLEHLLTRPYINTPQAKKILGVSYNTAKGDLAKLQDAHVLSIVKDVHPLTFVAHDVYRITFAEE